MQSDKTASTTAMACHIPGAVSSGMPPKPATSDPAIERLPASEVRDDSDLGDLPVTVAVGLLPSQKVALALENGVQRAAELQARGLIAAAYLQLHDQVRVVGALQQPLPSRAA